MKSTIILLSSLLIFGVVAVTSADQPQPIQYNSGNKQTVMLELYTSEGCSSCPPAERYLNSFDSHPQLWKTFVPLAFHVDYWDYIGWQDRFADAVHGQRQSRYAQALKQRTVYTPAFFVNGLNWRPGRLSKKVPTPDRIDVGPLVVSVSDNRVSAQFTPVNKPGSPLVFNVAVLGMDLSTEIKAGENSGRRAQHHFVVLAHSRKSSDSLQWHLDIPKYQDYGAKRLALVAWVSTPDHPAPLQAVGGFLPYRSKT